jgi:hypothetical protein
MLWKVQLMMCQNRYKLSMQCWTRIRPAPTNPATACTTLLPNSPQSCGTHQQAREKYICETPDQAWPVAHQGSQARGRVEIPGPKARRVFGRLIDFWALKGGHFDQSSRQNALARPLAGSWSKLAKALPPAGRNLQGKLASPVAHVPTVRKAHGRTQSSLFSTQAGCPLGAPAHAAGDTAQQCMTCKIFSRLCTQNCPHHCQALLLKLDAPYVPSLSPRPTAQ